MAEILGQPLLPWQRHVVDVALEVDDDDRLVYSEVVLSVMRRQGKTALARSVIVHRNRVLQKLWGPQHSIYTAQTGKDARRKWEDDQVNYLDRSRYGPLGRQRTPGRYAKVKLDNNDPGIFWRNGSSHRPAPPTETASHGYEVDLGVIDEAFALADDRVEQALGPAMLTRTCPQLWVMSAAGTDRSLYWWRKVTRGRSMCESGKFDGPVAYFEYSAADDEPFDDPDTWWRRMPALGFTVTEEAVAAELGKVRSGETVDADDEGAGDQGLERFLRPYLGVWCRFPADDRRPSAIPADAWQACRVPRQGAELADPVAFGVAVSPDRSVTTISAADRHGLVEVVDARLGVDWVVDRVAELCERWSPVGVAVAAPYEAGSLVPALESAGLPVVEVTSRNYQRACGEVFDAVMAGVLRHVGQDNLDASVASAAKRSVGDGLWTWDRRGSSADLTPLESVTVARWVSLTVEPVAAAPSGGFAFFDLEDDD